MTSNNAHSEEHSKKESTTIEAANMLYGIVKNSAIQEYESCILVSCDFSNYA